MLPEDPKQKAWFAKSDMKDLFTFQDDAHESDRNQLLRDPLVSSGKQFSSSTGASAGLPCAGIVNLVDRVDDDAENRDGVYPQHMDMDVNDDDRIMGEGIFYRKAIFSLLLL